MTVLAFRADRGRATAALLVSLVAASAHAGVPYLLSRVIAAALAGDRDRAVAFGVALGLSSAWWLGAALVRIDLRFRLEEATGMYIDRQLIALTTGMPGLEHHERPEHLDRLELLRAQRDALGGSIGALIENLGTMLAVLSTTGLLASVDVRLLLLPLFGLPSLAASAVTQKWRQRVEESTAERVRLARHLFELATTGPPAKELRVFGLRDEIRDRYTALSTGADREQDRLALRCSLLTMAGWAVFAIAYIGALVLVVREAVQGGKTAADVVLVVTLAGQVNQQVDGVYFLVGWLLATLKTVGRYLRLMDDSAVAQSPILDPAAAPDRLTEGIDFVGVGFRYPGTSVDVLRDVDLHIPAGSTIAIVGDNGAGKSTLIKLLCGFYSPSAGTVLVDGVDLRRIPLAQWRARMSAGFQDFARLEFVVRETVGVGDLELMPSVGAVVSALDRASGGDVVAGLADGLETQLGRSFEGGQELSGGQWQKLALGRAMMRSHPLLLVLDEPTAALDADTEHALFERYAGAARAVAAERGGITVLVSHRFSTVRMADLIVVIGGGAVVEVGTHEALMAGRGVYAELYELQARAYR
jgi:ATP-binding cassette subfamily B protein